MKSIWRVLAVAAVLFLAGCNGGGSGGDDADNTNNGSSPGVENTAPSADAGAGQNVTQGDTVTLDGSGSSDPDGDLLVYSWAFSSIPPGSSAQLNGFDTATPTFTADASGHYTVELTVNDGTTDSEPDSVAVVAASGNSAPVADAGLDQNVETGSIVTLDGSGSSDADSDPLTYAWSFVSRPNGSAATLSDPNAASPHFTADVDGKYVVQLVVNDGTTDSEPDQVTVKATTANSAPVADAGADQNVVAGDTVLLDGSASSDADSDPVTYSWQFVSVPSGSSATLTDADTVSPEFTAGVAGDYVAELVVNDGAVDSASDRVTVSAAVANVAPMADAGKDQNVKTGQAVTLDGSGSSDANGDMITYHWSFVSRPPGSSASFNKPTSVSPSFIADVDGDYVVELVVNDGTVDSAADRVTVTAKTPNSAPTADAGPDQNVNTSVLVNLDGAGSSDPDGDSLKYSWSFVSIPSGSSTSLANGATATPAFTPDVDGDYVVELVVSDGSVASVSDRVTITATTANSAPVADAGDKRTVSTGGTVTLDGSRSTDTDGDMLSYQWSFVSQPPGAAAALSGGNTASPSFVANKAGEYVLGLIVNDGHVDSARDTVTITAIKPDLSGVPLVASYSTNQTFLPSPPPQIVIETFTITAKGADFTILNLQAIDRNNVVDPEFDGLHNGMTIPAGQSVTFDLVTPPTNNRTANLLFTFTENRNGETFRVTATVTTN